MSSLFSLYFVLFEISNAYLQSNNNLIYNSHGFHQIEQNTREQLNEVQLRSIFLSDEQFRVLDEKKGNDIKVKCEDQITSQLQLQSISYNIQGNEIKLTSESSNLLEFDLQISNCILSRNVTMQPVAELRMKELKLQNILFQDDCFILFNNLTKIIIENVRLEELKVEGRAKTFDLAAKQIMQVNDFVAIDVKGTFISVDGSLEITTFKLISSTGLAEQQLYMVGRDTIIENLEIIGQSYDIIFDSINSLRIKNMKVICASSYIQLMFESTKVFIDQFEMGCTVKIDSRRIYKNYVKDELLHIKSLARPIELTPVPDKLKRDYELEISKYYEELSIDQIYMDSDHVIRFKFQQKVRTYIKSIKMNFQSELKFNKYSNLLLIYGNSIELLQIDEIIINSGDTNITPQIFKFTAINNMEIKSLTINNGRYKDKILFTNDVKNIVIGSLVCKNVFFQENALKILNVYSLDFSNFNVYIDITKTWIDQDVDPKLKNKEWQILYESSDGSRSFISVVNEKEKEITNEMFLMKFSNVIANFNGFKSRFLSAHYYNNKMLFDKIKLSNMKTHQNGGCLRFENSWDANIQFSEFHNCASQKFGGAIYSSYLVLVSVIFTNNSAKFGGAFSREYTLGWDDDVKFSNNQAEIQPNVFYFTPLFYASKVYQYIPNFNNTTPLIQLAEKIPSKKDKIEIKGIDNYQQWKIIPGIQYIAIIDYIFISVENRTQYIPYDNIYKGNFYDYSFSKSTNKHIYLSQQEVDFSITQNKSYLIFQLTSFQSQMTQIDMNYYPQQSSILYISSQDCIVGQQKVQITKDEHFFCQYCPYMMASHQQINQTCQSCDSALFSQCYANYSSLNPGLWRDHLTIQNELIYPCKYHLSACIGGYGYGNELCTEGRIGTECASCDNFGTYWNSSYASSSLYSCVKCSDISQNSLKFTFILIGFILALFLVVTSNSKKTSNIIYQNYLAKMNMIYVGNSFKKLGLTSVYIKILTFNSSMILFIQNQVDFSIKNSILSMQISLSNPLEKSFASVDCLISEYYPQATSIGQVKLRIYLLLPLIVIFLTLIFPIIKFILRKMSKRFLFYLIYLIITYTLFIVLFNTLLSISLDAVLCKTFQNGQRQSLLDFTVPCEKAIQDYTFPIIGLILYGIIVPLTFIVGLVKNRKQLNKISVLFKYGFLYSEYHNKFFYWEFIRFLLKVILLVISKVFLNDLEKMNRISILCLVIYLAILIKCQPLTRPFLNRLESISCLIVIINFLGIGVYSVKKNQLNQQDASDEYIVIGCFLLTLLFTITLIFFIAVSFFEAYILKLQKYKFFSKIISYFVFLQKYTYSQRTHNNFKKLRQLVKNNLMQNKNNIDTHSRLINYIESPSFSERDTKSENHYEMTSLSQNIEQI